MMKFLEFGEYLAFEWKKRVNSRVTKNNNMMKSFQKKRPIFTSKPTRWFGTHDDEFTASMTTRNLPFLLPLWWTYISSRHVSFVIPNVGDFNVRIVVVGSKRKCKKWPVQTNKINIHMQMRLPLSLSPFHTDSDSDSVSISVWIQWTDYKRLCTIAPSSPQAIHKHFRNFCRFLFAFSFVHFFLGKTNKQIW